MTTAPSPRSGTPRRTVPWTSVLLFTLLAGAACGGADPVPAESEPSPAAADRDEPPAPGAEAGASGASEDDELVLFLGDSLTAGYGLGESAAFPSVLRRLLEEEGRSVRILNAGVSGDTTAGGLRRLDWLLSQEPDIVVVELGANDGLRGLPIEHTEENLREILLRIRNAGARPLLVGMQVPPNYGPEYAPAFEQIFPRLARELDVPLVEFLLDGVGGRPELNLADGIHPTAEGHRILARNVLPHLQALLTDEPEPALHDSVR